MWVRGGPTREIQVVQRVGPRGVELERKAKLPKWAGGQMPQEAKPRSRRARRD
jgi:hypothetical protein